MGIFDYKIPDELESTIKIGHLVAIPFRAQEREGVVIKLKKTTGVQKTIKSVSAIIQPEPLLTQAQLKLADWMSRYYFVSIGAIIKMILPPIPKRKVKYAEAIIHSKEIKKSSEIKKIADITLSGKHARAIFTPNNYLDTEQYYSELFGKNKLRILVITPDIFSAENLLGLIPKKRHKTATIIHSKLNKNQLYDAYQSIIDGRSEIIVGTKAALFMPVKNIDVIIIDQEDDRNHKQSDQNPRFDARTTAKKLSEIISAPLVFVSSAPTVNSYSGTIENPSARYTLEKTDRSHVTTVDMRDERKKRNYSPFSDELEESINDTLKNNERVLLFINKRGSSTAVVCKDCGHVFSCKQCGSPLTYHERNNTLFCHSCSIKADVPANCPQCKNTEFKFSGLGTQKVENAARKKWATASIVRLDADTDELDATQKPDILIGTERALRNNISRDTALIGLISADTFLYLPDFRATERTWGLLHNLLFQNPKKLIIQTYSPEHSAIKNFTQNNPEQFYTDELAERTLLHYPPSQNLVKLIYQHKDKNACVTEAKRIYTVIKTSTLNTSLITPLRPFERNKWRMYVIIKFDEVQQEPLLKKVLSHVPVGWIIDRDPETLL